MTATPFARQLRCFPRVCLSLPGATEKLSHGEPTFFVHTRVFAGFSNNHHGDESHMRQARQLIVNKGRKALTSLE